MPSGNAIYRFRGPNNLPYLSSLFSTFWSLNYPISPALSILGQASMFALYSAALPLDCWNTLIFWELTKMPSPLCGRVGTSPVCPHYTNISIIMFNTLYCNYGHTVLLFQQNTSALMINVKF